MKRTQITALFAATIVLAFTGCDKKPGNADSGAAPKVTDEKNGMITFTGVTPNTSLGDTTGSGSDTEKNAIANFKTEVESVGKWIEEKQKSVQTDPAAGMAMMGEMVGKFKAIKTDGLPADLKGAWGEMGGVMTEMGEIFKGMPTAKPDKPEDAMKAMGELMPKIMAIQSKMEPAAKKLEEVGKKYGLDMSKVAPGK